MKFKVQFFSERLSIPLSGFPPSTVQSGMSPDISRMVKTRAVGGTLDEYEMGGISENAPFDSEYLDYFDMQDLIHMKDLIQNEGVLERKNTQIGSPETEAPSNEFQIDNTVDSNSEK